MFTSHLDYAVSVGDCTPERAAEIRQTLDKWGTSLRLSLGGSTLAQAIPSLLGSAGADLLAGGNGKAGIFERAGRMALTPSGLARLTAAVTLL